MPAPNRGDVWIVELFQVTSDQAVTAKGQSPPEIIPNFRGMLRAVAALLS